MGLHRMGSISHGRSVLASGKSLQSVALSPILPRNVKFFPPVLVRSRCFIFPAIPRDRIALLN